MMPPTCCGHASEGQPKPAHTKNLRSEIMGNNGDKNDENGGWVEDSSNCPCEQNLILLVLFQLLLLFHFSHHILVPAFTNKGVITCNWCLAENRKEFTKLGTGENALLPSCMCVFFGTCVLLMLAPTSKAHKNQRRNMQEGRSTFSPIPSLVYSFLFSSKYQLQVMTPLSVKSGTRIW